MTKSKVAKKHTKTISWFAELNQSAIHLAGGKGANLGELTQTETPVPPGFVITTKAYDSFVKSNQLQSQIIDLANQLVAANPSSFEVVAKQIQALFTAGVLSDKLITDIQQAYAQLAEENGPAVAVRSSATAEDLPTASFAGQQDTYLNVQGEQALVEAVKKCWASLWTARAISYRMRQGIDPATVSLAVVVQHLIPADIAGILFTANPTTGEREHSIINAAWGLGEAIVSGQVTPDTIVVDKSTSQIVSRDTATKTTMTIRTATGTTEEAVSPEQQNQPVLDDETATQLARYGAQIETHYGYPMDIEWAISAGKIAILQARPITKLPAAPLRDVHWEPIRPGSIWMRRQVVEHMPEPLSPLFDEIYLQEGLQQSMDEVMAFISDISGIKINMWEFFPPPFAATINGYAYSIASFNFSWKSMAPILKIYATVLPSLFRDFLPYWHSQALPAYLKKIDRWKKETMSDLSDAQLLEGVHALAIGDAIYWFAAAMPLGIARVTDALLDSFLKFTVGKRGSAAGPRPTSGAYLRGFPSKAMEAQAQLEAIARQIYQATTLPEQVVAAPARDLLNFLVHHPEGQPVLDAIQDYLDKYGHQIYNLDFAAPTQADDPLPVLLSLKIAVEHPERDVRTHQAKLAQEREALIEKTTNSLNPFSQWLFRLFLGWAHIYTPYREEALFYVGAAWPTLRKLALALGNRLTEAGSLNMPDDVFFLYYGELKSASEARVNGNPLPELAQLAEERRTLRKARKRLDPPLVVPKGARLKFGPFTLAMFEPQPQGASDGPTLTGFAVSPGRVTAPASIIHSPEDFDKMKPDTILVCPTTTPAWTPLFSQAKGLVTDIGGALAHGSIVAREYGIPAVMGTGAATQRIQDGQLIEIDGDTGIVTLVDEMEAQTTTEIPSAVTSQATATLHKIIQFILIVGLVVSLITWWKKRQRRING